MLTADLAAQKLYKWVDKDGNVSYQDRPAAEKNTDSHELQPKIKSSASSSTTSDAERRRPVVVYTSEDCEACEQVLEYFESIGVTALEKSISDREVQQRIFEIAGSLSVPSVFIGEALMSDTNYESLLSNLLDAGYKIESPAEEKVVNEQSFNREPETNSPETSE